MHITIPSWLIEWLKGAGGLWLLATVIHLMPAPVNPSVTVGQKLYLWLYDVLHAVGANWSKIQFNLPSPTRFSGILLVLAALGACAPAMAQTPAPAPAPATAPGLEDQTPQTQFMSVYLGVNSGASSNPFGGAFYGRHLTGLLFSISGYDVTAVPGQTMKIGTLSAPMLKFTNWTSLGLKAAQFGPIVGWVKGNAGLATSGDKTSFSGGLGGFVTWLSKKGWGASAGVDWIHDGINGDGYIIRIGPAWGK